MTETKFVNSRRFGITELFVPHLEGDAELVEFPRNPLIADIERLGLTFADAIAGKPGSDGTRLSDWDINRVEAWMEAVEDAFKPVQAGSGCCERRDQRQ